MSYSSEQTHERRTVSFQLDPETYAALERRAKALGLSVGAYVKVVAMEFLEREPACGGACDVGSSAPPA